MKTLLLFALLALLTQAAAARPFPGSLHSRSWHARHLRHLQAQHHRRTTAHAPRR